MRNCLVMVTLLMLAAGEAFGLTVKSVTITGSDPVTFRLTLSGFPDLVTEDEFGRPADAIGLRTTTDLQAEPGINPQLVLRSGDALGMLVAYDGATGDSVAALPYALTGRTVSFAVPLSMIGDSQFRYELLVLEYGIDTDTRNGLVGFHGRAANGPEAQAVSAPRMSWGRLKALYAGR